MTAVPKAAASGDPVPGEPVTGGVATGEVLTGQAAHRGPGWRIAAALGVTVAAAVVALVSLWLVVTPWDEPIWPLLVFVPVPAVAWLLVSRSGVGRLPVVMMWVAVVAVMVATVGLSVSGTLTRARYDAVLDAMTVASIELLSGVDVPTESCGLAPVLDYGSLGVPVSVCVVTYDIGLGDFPVVAGGTGETASGRWEAMPAPNQPLVQPVAQPLAMPGPSSVGPASVGPAVVGPASFGSASVGSTGVIAVRQVRYIWGSDRSGTPRELVFEAAVAQPPAGRCVRPVRTQWWAWMDNGLGCPRGFVSSSQ